MHDTSRDTLETKGDSDRDFIFRIVLRIAKKFLCSSISYDGTALRFARTRMLENLERALRHSTLSGYPSMSFLPPRRELKRIIAYKRRALKRVRRAAIIDSSHSHAPLND